MPGTGRLRSSLLRRWHRVSVRSLRCEHVHAESRGRVQVPEAKTNKRGAAAEAASRAAWGLKQGRNEQSFGAGALSFKTKNLREFSKFFTVHKAGCAVTWVRGSEGRRSRHQGANWGEVIQVAIVAFGEDSGGAFL